jgi:dUTPase
MAQLVLQVKKLSEHAVLPARATPGAAGYDLCR